MADGQGRKHYILQSGSCYVRLGLGLWLGGGTAVLCMTGYLFNRNNFVTQWFWQRYALYCTEYHS